MMQFFFSLFACALAVAVAVARCFRFYFRYADATTKIYWVKDGAALVLSIDVPNRSNFPSTSTQLRSSQMATL